VKIVISLSSKLWPNLVNQL